MTAYASQTKANGPLEAELLSLMDGVKICAEKHNSNEWDPTLRARLYACRKIRFHFKSFPPPNLQNKNLFFKEP